jgi:MFS family permease
MGFAYLGIGIGGAAVPLLSVRLTQMFGWRTALEAIGIIIIVISLPLVLLVKEKSQPILRESDSRPLESANDVFRKPEFYLLALGSMCSIGAVGGANQHLKLFLSLDQHYAADEAAQIISLVLTFSIAGRLLMGWLADRIPKKVVMLLIYALVGSSIPLLFLAARHETMFLFSAVFGIGLGGEYMIIPLIAAELFGLRVLGRVMGVILTADGVAEAVFPMLIGYLRDQSGAYRTGFLLLVGLALAGALAVAFLPRRESILIKEPVAV